MKGVPSPSNRPCGRDIIRTWVDSDGILWLFGGCSDHGYLSDLWKFNGSNWTLIAGNEVSDQAPVYGTKGIRSVFNTPARIFSSASWVGQGRVWVFGGYVPGGMTNALWKYEP